MRDETKRALDRMVAEERSHGRSAIFGIVVLALAFGAYYALTHTTTSRAKAEGVVKYAVWRIDEETGRRYAAFQVMLDNGSLVEVDTPLMELPEVGARAVLERQTTALGTVRYKYRKVMP